MVFSKVYVFLLPGLWLFKSVESVVRDGEIHSAWALWVMQVENSTVRLYLYFQRIFLLYFVDKCRNFHFLSITYISKEYFSYILLINVGISISSASLIFRSRCVQNHDHYTLLNLVNAVKYHISVITFLKACHNQYWANCDIFLALSL